MAEVDINIFRVHPGSVHQIPNGPDLFVPDLVCETCAEKLMYSLAKDEHGNIYLKVFECMNANKERWELQDKVFRMEKESKSEG